MWHFESFKKSIQEGKIRGFQYDAGSIDSLCMNNIKHSEVLAHLKLT